jgi:hypothetical protein
MRWAGHVVRMGLMGTHAQIWSENLQDHTEDLGVDRRIILEWILGKYDGKVWIGFMWLRIGTIGGPL